MLGRFVGRVASVPFCVRTLAAAAATNTAAKVDKDALLKLRKRTGYSFVNCKKALDIFGPDQLGEAEKWLKELAQKEGWTKAAKLSSRQTTQGLVGVHCEEDVAAVVELTCETDFVARGERFRKLLSDLISVALLEAKKLPANSSGQLTQKQLQLDSLSDDAGRPLRDILTMAIGDIRENLVVRRIVIYRVPPGSTLFASSHPKEEVSGVFVGRFVSLVALRRPSPSPFPIQRLADQLCQHIIGMNSESLGTPLGEGKEVKATADIVDNQDELNEFFKGQTTELDANETRLLRQSFMLNPSQTVHEYASSHKTEIIDFARLELSGPVD